MRKNITLDSKNIKRFLTEGGKIIILGFGIIISGLLSSNGALADNINAGVGIRPSITFTIPTSDISMSLNPATKPFDTRNIPITVGTNNPTGYQVFVNAIGTDLVNTEDTDKTIPTLTSPGFYDATSFPADYWGYRINTGSYIPFALGNIVSSSNSPINEKTDNMTVAAKIDYLQPQGTYKITLNFSIIATPPTIFVNTMQEMGSLTIDEKQMLKNYMAEGQPYDIIDTRDGQNYTITKLKDGNIWMTSNLRLGRNDANPATTTINLTPDDSNVTQNRTITAYDFVSHNSSNCYGPYNPASPTSDNGPGYTTPCMHSKDTTSGNNTIGVWYNYATATAGTIANPGNTTITTEATEDICPKGWRLPLNAESQTLVSMIGSTPSSFNPVYGGLYYSGMLYYPTTYGGWWSSTAENGAARYYLYYSAENLATIAYDRSRGYYIRCILK